MGKIYKRSEIKQSEIDKFNKKAEKRRNKESKFAKFAEYCEKSVNEQKTVRCPYCGSTDVIPVAAPKRKAFSTGKALAGGILTGGVGLLAGFAGKNGKDATFMCTKCSKTFKHKI